MIVHVLTPVTRPDNLPDVGASLARACERAPHVEIVWHLSFDHERRHIGGFGLRNRMLDRIPLARENWCYMHDDDTLMHPDLLDCARRWSSLQAVIVGQSRPPGWHSGCADPVRIRSGSLRSNLADDDCVFDTGMAVFRRSLIGDWRFPETREADGTFWDEVLAPCEEVAYIGQQLAFYNALRPGEWG